MILRLAEPHVLGLIAESDEAVSEETLAGPEPGVFMQIPGFPGAGSDNGEMMFDEVFEEHPGDPERAAACDDSAREFLYNLVRAYEDLEYVNLGSVVNSLPAIPSPPAAATYTSR